MIEFMTEGVDMPRLDFERIRKWICEVAASHDFTVGNLNYCFCDDAYILETNRKFLQHDYYTDIITFDYTRRGRIGGDMVISLDTVASNAAGLGVGYDSELLRVIIHGVLHLCGIDDKGPGEREIMEEAENKALEIYEI
ncbi:MAG: rRNA maturation RNase YbeY [Muribaculaceae bacterium]|nr:rRNA maturation RNase YbeY [Muribaculaceae bacterium]